MSLDRTPPQNVDLEMEVLGAIMLDPTAYKLAASILSREDFYLDGHGIMFALMGELHDRGIPPDSVALLDELRSRGQLDKVGGVSTVLGMVAGVASASRVEAHSRKVSEKSIARQGIRVGTELTDELYRQELDPRRALDEHAQKVAALASTGTTDTAVKLHTVADEYWSKYNDPAPVLPTGYPRLDHLLRGGIALGTIMDVMARTTVGKSALVLNIATNIALSGVPVLFFSLEMPAAQLYERMLTSLTFECKRIPYSDKYEYHGVNNYHMRSDRMTADELASITAARQVIQRLPLRIEDNVSVTPRRFRMMCGQFARKVPKGLIVLDYLQAMESDDPRSTDYSRTCEVSRTTRIVARETGFPVLRAVQLGRSATQAGRPRMQHAEGAGKIEQDAYTVLVIDRDDLRNDKNQGQAQIPEMPMPKELAPVATIHLDKNRNGFAGGVLKYKYVGPLTRFVED